jgi:hypothetical protein
MPKDTLRRFCKACDRVVRAEQELEAVMLAGLLL